MNSNIDKDTDRKIDDPGLNQDSTYDKKDDENFDDSDDFHKNDDTDTESDKNPKDETVVKEPSKSPTPDEVKEIGLNDGNIAI